MKKSLYIIGAGSVGGHLAVNIKDYSDDYDIAGFFDDDPEKIGTEQFGYSVVGPVKEALGLKNKDVAIGIAFPQIKKKVIELLSENNSISYPSLIHSKAWISNTVLVGQGTVVYPGTSINYGSEIGDFVLMNMNCALGHHTRIGNYTSLAPGVNTGGHTVVEETVDLGIGASTIQEVTIGANSVIGGQTMVIQDISPGSTAVGIPARILNK